MKSNIATAAFLLFFILLFSFGMNSCAGEAAEDRFAYTKRDFDADICGAVDGTEIAATLKSRPSDVTGECSVSLVFESPKSLRGLVVSRGDSGKYDARLGELIVQDFDADGLIQPFLTLIYSGEISSLRRDSDGNTIVSVQNGDYDLEYVFSKDFDYPSQIKGRIGERKIELLVQSLDFT